MKENENQSRRKQILTSRREGIYEEPLGHQIVLFDSANRESLTLNAAAAFVWSRCDGKTTLMEIITAFERKNLQGQGEAEVLTAINLLAGKGLLLDENSMPVAPTAHSRRAMLTYGALAAKLAILFPALASILGPSGAEAATVRPPRSVQPVSTGTRRRGSNGGGRGRGNGQKGPGRGNHQTPPAAVDCYGGWGEWSECDSYMQGLYITGREYTVIVPAANGGQACEAAHGAVETRICPIVDCDGSWGRSGGCSATCGGGLTSEVYSVRREAAGGGVECPAGRGAIRNVACNTEPCPSLNCQGFWAFGPCSVTCGDGVQLSTYRVSILAANGGAPCPAADGQSGEPVPCSTNVVCPTDTGIIGRPCPSCASGSACVSTGGCQQICPTGFPSYCCYHDPTTAYAMAHPEFSGWNLVTEDDDPDCPSPSMFSFL